MGDESPFIEVPGQFEHYDMDGLELDHAFLNVTSSVNKMLYLYALNEDCIKCPYEQLAPGGRILPAINRLYEISTKRGWDFFLSDVNVPYLDPDSNTTNPTYECDLPNQSLGEFGVYRLQVDDDDCSMHILKEPVPIYGGIIISLIVYLALLGIVKVYPYVMKELANTGLATCFRAGPATASQTELSLDKDNDEGTVKQPVKQRIKSLDTFRGLSIVLMIFVNYGGGRYWFMGHATWDGLLVADLVFPWFMWIMGVCIPMGLRSALKRKVPKWKIFLRIFKRSLKLFALGIILNSLGGWVTLTQYRVPGILQRFAICYLVVAGVALFLPEIKERDGKLGRVLGDVIGAAWQWLFHLVFLTIYLIILFCLPVPGCPTGYIGPGGIDLFGGDGQAKPSCIGGATGQIDKWLLGKNHIYQNPTAKFVYSAGPFDPEGVLGSMPSIFQVFLGLVAGNILHYHKSDNGRMIRWLVWAVICGLIGTILCFAGMDGAPIPVNKNLWSLSYVMVTSCFAFILLALFYLLVDKLRVWSGSPLYQAGMNSIFLYCGHNVTFEMFPWHYIIGPMRTHAALLAECLWGTTLWVITGLYLHSIGQFYTV